MCCYTHYKVEVKPPIENLNQVLKEVAEGYAFHECGFYGKWYEHEKHLKLMSESYHEHIFALIGSGEDSWNIWRKYFKNGKMQYCPAKITFDDFDESKLV